MLMVALSTWRNVYMRGVIVIHIYNEHLYEYRPNRFAMYSTHISLKNILSFSLNSYLDASKTFAIRKTTVFFFFFSILNALTIRVLPKMYNGK